MSANDNTILARLKMQGVGQFVADAGAATKSILGFGVAEEKAAAATKLHYVETKLLQQGVYTLRRELFYGTVALQAGVAAGVKMGLVFDQARQSATSSFSATLHSASAARREVDLLTEGTHQTGIQLSDLASKAETMESFGFTLAELNKDVLTLANYSERAGKGLAGFESLINIFDRIHQKGALTGLDLRTLANEGIPAIEILRRQLNLTDAQTRALQANKLIIPARYALPALQQGIQQRANVLGTDIQQQLGIMHSYLSQIFGTGEKSVFGFVTSGIASINSRLAAAARGQQAGGVHGLLLGLDPSGTLLASWTILAADAHALGDALHFAWMMAFPLRETLVVLAHGSALLAHDTGLISLALKVATGWYVLSRTRLIALTIATNAAEAAEYAYIAALYLYDIAAAVATADTLALGLAIEATPVGILILGLAAISVAAYEVGTHIGFFKNLLVGTFDWTRQHWPLLAEIIAAPFTFGLSLALTHLGYLQQKIEGFWSWLRQNVFTITFVPHLASGIDWNHPLHIGGFKGPSWHDLISFPGLASGGVSTRAGWSVVGENGPELRYLPVGAQVWPTRSPLATMTPARTSPLSTLNATSTPVRVPMLANGGTITRAGLTVVGDGGSPELARIGPASATALPGGAAGDAQGLVELARALKDAIDTFKTAALVMDSTKVGEIVAQGNERKRQIT